MHDANHKSSQHGVKSNFYSCGSCHQDVIPRGLRHCVALALLPRLLEVTLDLLLCRRTGKRPGRRAGAVPGVHHTAAIAGTGGARTANCGCGCAGATAAANRCRRSTAAVEGQRPCEEQAPREGTTTTQAPREGAAQAPRARPPRSSG